MAWEDDMVTIVRVLVNDIDAVTYADDTLIRVLVVAAFQVLREPISFSQVFQVDFGNDQIAPDPTKSPTNDESFVNLTTLKAACIIDQGVATLAAKQAIAVGDGSSKIDLRERGITLLKLLAQGWCKVYDVAKFEYQSGKVQVAGAAVMSPFRLYAEGLCGPREIRY